jgi:hypothetical protein
MDNTLEPLLSEYFPVVNNNITTIQGNNTIIQGNNTPIQLSNDDPTDKDKSRGDMLLHDIKNGKAFIVDFKLTEATAKYIRPHTRATQPAQQGEEIKINDYKKRFDITPTNNAEMIFFTLTTQGAPSKDAKKLIDMLFQDEPAESKNIKKQQFLERLSSGIQTMRSVNIQNVLQHYTTRERPPPSSSEIIQSSHSLSFIPRNTQNLFQQTSRIPVSNSVVQTTVNLPQPESTAAGTQHADNKVFLLTRTLSSQCHQQTAAP